MDATQKQLSPAQIKKRLGARVSRRVTAVRMSEGTTSQTYEMDVPALTDTPFADCLVVRFSEFMGDTLVMAYVRLSTGLNQEIGRREPDDPFDDVYMQRSWSEFYLNRAEEFAQNMGEWFRAEMAAAAEDAGRIMAQLHVAAAEDPTPVADAALVAALNRAEGLSNRLTAGEQPGADPLLAGASA